jgi:biopolymer transport protein ExbD
MRRLPNLLVASILVLGGILLYLEVPPIEHDFEGSWLLPWIAAFVITGGLVGFVRWVRNDPSLAIAEEKSFSSPPTGGYQAHVIRKRVRGRRKPLSLPNWSFFVVSIFIPLAIIVWWLSAPAPKIGLWVSILRTAPTSASLTTKTPNILLQVSCVNRKASYDLDGRIVPIERLRYEIKQELAKQPDWIVYVKGDPDCDYQNILFAIDIIRGLHARAILATEKTVSLLREPARSASKK